MPTPIDTVRRQNVINLFQRFVEERVSAGDQPKGVEQSFAEHVGIAGSTWSMARSGSRPIGNKLARQIESRCGVEEGWLDIEREPQGMSPAEQQFVAMALQTYRATNSDGRRRLRTLLKSFDT